MRRISLPTAVSPGSKVSRTVRPCSTSQSLEFHQRVRQGFLDLAAADPEHYAVLDARAPIDEIAADIRARVAPLLEDR